jgi:hypothetical protein
MPKITATPNPMYKTATSLDAAFQIIEAELSIDQDRLLPLVMLYHNTLLREKENQDVE